MANACMQELQFTGYVFPAIRELEQLTEISKRRDLDIHAYNRLCVYEKNVHQEATQLSI